MSFANPRLRFGKYKDDRISDVPTDYLKWLDSLPDLMSRTRRAVRAELKHREEEARQRAAELRRLGVRRKPTFVRDEGGPL